ncbi:MULTISPECIES: YlbL family protein [Protofrankia]|uniref:endopeptidase La n=1 Tax=Candidatus Protofrankia datiscae TaxID=2716812 RepID=F8B2I5_9ACTN|nr:MULTISPECIES: PDZ domain-containing protein [Protofrankia]AEH08441.1 PDZ/DHR/GLGF domain protein [Candidatus Protofrankia datiscae]
MTRRIQTLVVASTLSLLLVVIGLWLPVPFVLLSPGPVTDTLGRPDGKPLIEIEGRQTYPTSGRLELTTVEEIPRLNVLGAVRGWLNSDQAVVPRELVQPPGTSDEQIRQENTVAMIDSQDQATAAALGELGVAATGTSVVVYRLGERLPAEGKLLPGDVIVSVNGTAVTTQGQLRDEIARVRPGQPVTISYVRDGGEPARADITTVPAPDDQGRPVIGIITTEKRSYPFTVTIRLKDVGGPSAGLMFALGIVDLLGPEQLTGGQTIAGTGTIDAAGTVGPIGGIQQKLLGARRSGAMAFLVPAGNCADARESAPDGLRLIRVETLKDAIGDLHALADNPQANVPTC